MKTAMPAKHAQGLHRCILHFVYIRQRVRIMTTKALFPMGNEFDDFNGIPS